MNPLFNKMRNYVSSLGGDVIYQAEEPGSDTTEIFSSEKLLRKKLPLFISTCYDFCRATVFGRACLLVMSKHQKQLTPEQIIAHKKILEKMIPDNLLFVFPRESKEFCQILLKAHIPFVIPEVQIYFSETMIAIREDKFNTKVSPNRDFLSPLAQVILLRHLLYKEHGNELSFQSLQKNMNINKVYISRSVKELEQSEIVQTATVRKMKSLVFLYDRHSLWEKMQDKLTSPVIKRIRIDKPQENSVLAGISALSKLTMLNDNENPTYAIYGRGKKFGQNEIREFSGDYLELWKYNPNLLSEDGKTADKLSLYLSLKDDSDPRVASELRNMMEAFQW